jgi:hypothetical protein
LDARTERALRATDLIRRMTTPDPDNEATFVEHVIKSDLAETAGPREAILTEMMRLG